MLETTVRGAMTPGGVTLVLMHFLGGSGREWDEVREELGDGVRTVTVDLPGFGGSAGHPGYSMEQMADAVEEAIGALRPERYVLVGHSMSGSVAMVLARRFAERCAGAASTGHNDAGAVHGERLAGLEGLVLVAPSPPGPEPMEESKREQMILALGEVKDGDRARARAYVTKNEERDIPAEALERTVDEVLKMNRLAWVAWLARGSKEDWAERIGVLELPVLVVAGEKDRSLGPEAQREHTLPALKHGRMVVVKGCSHLVPLERPGELAGLLQEFVAELGAGQDASLGAGAEAPLVPLEYREFIAGDRLSGPTRTVLEKRMRGPEPSDVLTEMQMRTLRAMCGRVVPQEAGDEIDLAGTIAARLATGKGDGWRYAVLPEDLEAYRVGLDALGESGLDAMSAAMQDETLRDLAAHKGSPEARWFEELRSDAVEAYVSHPATMARVGFSGPGVGGAKTVHQGFVELSIGEVESWEPPALAGQRKGDER